MTSSLVRATFGNAVPVSLRAAAKLALLLFAGACSSTTPGAALNAALESAVSAPNDAQSGLDANNLMSDDELERGGRVTTAAVQGFLEKMGSGLAGYREDGDSAAEAIIREATRARISPIYLIARIQTESSLVQSGNLDGLESAAGCGCPDGASCDRSVEGFRLQVRCAAMLIRSYLGELQTEGVTRSGWQIGVPHETLDGCIVVPANAATAALYTYNPWVGAYAHGCGAEEVGGASSLARNYYSYAIHFPGTRP